MSVPTSGIPQLAAGFWGNSIVIATRYIDEVAGAPIFVQISCIQNNVGVPIWFDLISFPPATLCALIIYCRSNPPTGGRVVTNAAGWSGCGVFFFFFFHVDTEKNRDLRVKFEKAVRSDVVFVCVCVCFPGIDMMCRIFSLAAVTLVTHTHSNFHDRDVR